MFQNTHQKIDMHIKAPAFRRWGTYFQMGVMCTIGAVFIIVAVFEVVPIDPPEHRTPFLVFAIIWTVAVCFFAYAFLKMPTAIHVADAGNITFASPVRKISIEVNEITKLILDSDKDWMLYHTKGKLDLRYFRHNELKRFFNWVVLANSGVETPDELRTHDET